MSPSDGIGPSRTWNQMKPKTAPTAMTSIARPRRYLSSYRCSLSDIVPSGLPRRRLPRSRRSANHRNGPATSLTVLTSQATGRSVGVGLVLRGLLDGLRHLRLLLHGLLNRLHGLLDLRLGGRELLHRLLHGLLLRVVRGVGVA